MKTEKTGKCLLAAFDDEENLLRATREFRESGFCIQDAFTPFPVHGMDDAMGLQPSKLPVVCFAFAMLGLLFAAWLQYWTSTISWPINVGGRPWNSWPAFAPVCFELMVLCAGLGTVAALFVRCRLFPGRRAALIHPGVTDDRFVLVLRKEDASFDPAKAKTIFEKHHALNVRELEGE